ncbi:MAG: XRE family transcriptional regulator [Eubacterium sp.]|nr:XRE family transcriptional regulator [Eubacterium sp.]
MNDNKLIGEKIKNYRKENRLTLKQLEEASGISAGYISKIERGTVNPSVKNIQKLCFALGITANELMIDDTEVKTLSDSHAGHSYVLRKSDRIPIYGITNAMDFESVFEDTPNFKLNAMTLAPEMKEQSYTIHSYDEFGIIAKGVLGISIGEVDYRLAEGDCIMIRANTRHAVTNLSDEECVSYWIAIRG